MAPPADDVAKVVRADLKAGKCQFLCSSAGTNDDMHVPGLSQEEVDAVMRDFEVTLTWYVYDGHEFVIRADGGIDTSAMEQKHRHAEQYNRCLYELLTTSDIFPRKKNAEPDARPNAAEPPPSSGTPPQA